MHDAAVGLAWKQFDDHSEFGSDAVIDKYRKKLSAALDREMENHRKINAD